MRPVIFGVAPREVQQRQERVPVLSRAVMDRLIAAEQRLASEDCSGTFAALTQARTWLAALTRARADSGLSPEGPFGVAAAKRHAALAARAESVCGGALAYERRR
jgi:hypothetical protein